MKNQKTYTNLLIEALVLIVLFFHNLACTKPVTKSLVQQTFETEDQAINTNQITIFPQIHSNLNGMVREFVRTMFQDREGNIWFGSNGNGLFCYNGKTLQKITDQSLRHINVVRKITEDKKGNIWFGTDQGLVAYDGENYKVYSEKEGLPNKEIWGLMIDKDEKIWVGSIGGISYFDGNTFIPFQLPVTKVDKARYMLSEKLVFKFLEDSKNNMWFVTDGNGIFKYTNGKFTHLTNKNGLSDNNVSDILEDKKGNIWIGTFNGGVSKFDGNKFTNYTQEGTIEGLEAYNFCEDRLGNIWFSAEGFGVYRYDGADFKQFTTVDGLATDVVQSIFEDKKGQLWFGTWQGISIYDGLKFSNAKDIEPWTN